MAENDHLTKQERLENWLAEYADAQDLGMAAGEVDLCLRGYVDCFNRAAYYEAHDVLEHAWLRLPRDAPEWAFLKGMIQLAGGFVHLRLHYLEPGHRVHGRRLGPAAKLFTLAEGNLVERSELADALGLRLEELLTLARAYSPSTDNNPWAPDRCPKLTLKGQLTRVN